jgi:ankyrin repeat protein
MSEQHAISGNFGMGAYGNDMSETGDGLIEAAMSGDIIKVRQLLADGADVNFANRLGVTALMVAAQWNRPEIVRFLLSKGADVEAVENSSGCNALMFACLSGNPDLVSLVLEHGAPVDSTNIDGRTALITAAFCGAIKVVRVLLEHGADIGAMDRFGENALTQASMAGHRDVENLLVRKGADKTRKVANSIKQRSLS